jgi:flagella basal body P-ring formation protein FlgA
MKGDTVRLTNPSTGNTVYAVVTGPSRARITH